MPRQGEEFLGAGAPGSYLTPYQRRLEMDRMAGADLDWRSQPLVDTPNPLLVTSGGGMGVTEAPAAAPPSTTGGRNPLVAPPVPMSTMSTDQRIAWQAMNADALKQQTDTDRSLLEQEISRREETHKAEMLRQSKELIARSVELDPTDLKGYPLARAKLARDYPIGAGTPETQRALQPLDDIHKQASGYDTWYKKEEEKQNQTQAEQRRNEALKQAQALGPEATARFFNRQKAGGDEAAIQGVLSEADEERQANLRIQLKNTGMTDEEITAKYGGGGAPFHYPAAEAEAKVRIPPGQEAQRYSVIMGSLQKLREASGYDPKKGFDENWTAQQEEAYQNSIAQFNSSLKRAGVRAGVQGVGDVNQPVTQPVTTPAATATPTATPAPAAQPRLQRTFRNPKTGETQTWRYVNGNWEKG